MFKQRLISYKTLFCLCSVLVTVFSVYLYVHAGNIDSPAIPSNDAGRMYTLKNIYDYLNSVDSAVPSKPSGGFSEPTSGPASTMYTTDSVFAKLVRLPATGQTTSYPAGGGTDIDDGHFQSGATILYSDNGDGTITDSNTKLMWIKQPELIIPGATGVTFTNQIQAARGNWATGTAYSKGDLANAKKLEEGVVNASRSGSVVTASSAIFSADDIGRIIYINGALQGTVRIFTDSTHVTVSSSGTTSLNPLSIRSFYVCAVAHTSGGTTFTADITANPTYWRETKWTSSAANLTTPATMRWDNAAIVNCEALDYAGYQDWRLPNLKELVSIVNYGAVNPSINTTAFPNTKSDYYWSSTTYAGFTGFAWIVSFNDGNPVGGNKAGTFYVRCVRGQ
ncbi:MAG: DUF1566 domain-containing protein [Patescibacteria group bacterium]